MSALDLALCLTLWTLGQAAIPEPPAQGKPDEFTGGIGSFRAELLVQPQKVKVDEPFTLTVRITARPGTTVHKVPGRPDLTLNQNYTRAFLIDTPDPPMKKSAEGVWEFYYLLRARSEDIVEVPDLLFVYFDPAKNPNDYQKTYADAQPLTVTPAMGEPDEPAKPLPTEPASLYAVPSGERIRAASTATLLPSWWQVLLVALLPPLGCALWYWMWRRRNPDAARRAVLRRSRAANEALHSLARCQAAQPVEQVLTRFLRQRFDLPVAAPTPLEAMTHLMRAGVSLESVQRTGEVYRALAAARYAPAATSGPLDRAVLDLITELENESCRASLSC